MFDALRAVLLTVLGFAVVIIGGFLVSSSRNEAPPKTSPPLPSVNVASSTALAPAAATTSAPIVEKPVAVVPKPTTAAPKTPPAPAPKPSSIPKPGTPEYEKSLEDALTALAKLNAATGPATPLNDRVRAAVVNLHCTSQSGGLVRSISASGVMIDPKGVIITNSHVAHHLLLKDYPKPDFLQCVIRTGSPAYPAYTLEILFIPPAWIATNAKTIKEEEPEGTGEYDYALLRVTGTVNPKDALPSAFPYLPPSYEDPEEGRTVLIAGYAAGFLGGIEVTKNLYASSSFGKIGEIYTYTEYTPDIFSLGGSIVAQQGSSGGAVADENGNLIGVVVNSTITPDTASRDLRALSLSYIARDFRRQSGVDLRDFLSGNVAASAAAFQQGIAPTLTRALVSVIED